jgi:hypothetical protein
MMVVNPDHSIDPEDTSEAIDPGLIDAWVGREANLAARTLEVSTLEVEASTPDMVLRRMRVS